MYWSITLCTRFSQCKTDIYKFCNISCDFSPITFEKFLIYLGAEQRPRQTETGTWVFYSWVKVARIALAPCVAVDSMIHDPYLYMRRHQMETFSPSLALCAGNSPVTGEFPYKGQWRGALIFSLICAWINNGEAGDLRRHRAHYEVIVMKWHNFWDPYQKGFMSS